MSFQLHVVYVCVFILFIYPNFSAKYRPLITDELFVEVSAQVSQQPNTNLDRHVNLKRKRQCTK